MDPTTLRERMEAFERWHYAIELAPGVVTPCFEDAHVVRHQERHAHFFAPLVRWLGGLQGRRVLDLGCNAGSWSLAALEGGADHVHGIDGRPMHVAQSELVREARGYTPEQWTVSLGDVLTEPLPSNVDVVLCLGLLYHLHSPLALLQRITELQPEVVVVDTEVHPGLGNTLRVGFETPSDPRSAVGTTVIAVPTVGAITAMLEQAGYRTAVLRPAFQSWEGSPDYRDGWRRCIIAHRTLDPTTIGVPVESARAPVRQVVRWLKWALRSRR